MEPVRTALVGITGIGAHHRAILQETPYFELVAAADRWLERPPVAQAAAELREAGVRVYGDFGEMLGAEPELEAAVIATPHPFHAPYTDACLEQGWHVLCEKPVTVLGADGLALAEKARQRRLFVAVHLQYAAYKHSLALKDFICQGELGELVEVIGVMEWKRTDEYYRRADWVGKRFYEGLPCWDGVLMNQAVHLLNSALQLGTREAGRALPLRVQAELYRTHDIECEDTACLRADLGEATLHFYATTCCDADYRTTLEIIGTRGKAYWNTEKAIVQREDGEELIWEMPRPRDTIHANWAACIRGLEQELFTPISESVKPTLTINGAYLSAGRIPYVSWEALGDIRGLMDQAAQQRQLFSEMGVSWAQPGEIVEQADFASFTGVLAD